MRIAWLTKRMMFLRYSIWDHWRFLWWAVPFLFGALFFYRDEFIPDDIQGKYQIIDLIPHWEASTWIIWGLVAVFIVFFEGTFRRFSALEEKYEKLLTPMLNLEFDPTQSTYSAPEFQMYRKRFRVCVRNDRMIAAKNVTVKLTRIAPCPQASGILPITLREKDAEQPFSSSFTINPQDHKFIDVLKVTPVFRQTRAHGADIRTPIPYFEFLSADQASLMIPVSAWGGGAYEMTIRITGEGGVGDSRNFILGIKEGRHLSGEPQNEYFMEMLPRGEVK